MIGFHVHDGKSTRTVLYFAGSLKDLYRMFMYYIFVADFISESLQELFCNLLDQWVCHPQKKKLYVKLSYIFQVMVKYSRI